MASMRIQGKEFSIGKIFGGEFIFKIPEYQRPYAWSTKEAGALLDDLLYSIRDGVESDFESYSDQRIKKLENLNQYFLGNIVIIKEDNKPEAEVVDGQQRLVTLTILLSALCDVFGDSLKIHQEEKARLDKIKITNSSASLDKQITELDKQIENCEKFSTNLAGMITEPENILYSRPARPKLTLNDAENNSILHDFIQTKGKIEELRDHNKDFGFTQKNIRDNAIYFKDRLKSLKNSEDVCEDLSKFIASNCIMVVVSTIDFDSAYRIFSVINDSGLDLTHSDKLKAEIIGKVTKGLRFEEAKKWDKKEDDLGRKAFGDLFYHIRMIGCKTKPRGNILSDFREFVIKPIGDPIKVIERILNYADIYEVIINCSYYLNSASTDELNDINTKLAWLDKIDNKDWIPPAMLYMFKFSDAKPNELIIFLKDLERLAAGLMILRADVNERIRRYSSVLKSIDKASSYNDLVNDKSLELSLKEREEIIEILDGDLYLELQIRLYVLYYLNDAFSDECAKIKGKFEFPKQITIEHIMPQTLPKNGEFEKNFKDPLHANYVHRLGNLALLTRRKGAEASNHEFEKKKEDYTNMNLGIATSSLIMQAMRETSWTPDVIDRLQEVRLNKLKEIWQL